MNKELYVSTTPHETKVALVEDDQLAEVYFERENEYTLAGSIYKGRVTRVLPGMQSAFVDIGLERDAFLYVSDFLELPDEDEDGEFSDVKVTGQTLATANGMILPEPQPVAEEESGDEEEEDEPVAAAEAAPQGEQRDGGRWRGRRRRRGRRGGRERAPGERQPESQPGTAEPGAEFEAQPVGEEEGEDEAPSTPPRKRELRGFEPRGLVVHGLARNVDDADAVAPEEDFEVEETEASAEEPQAAPSSSAVVLPGESISKYSRGAGEAPPESAGDELERTPVRESRDRGGRFERRGRPGDRGRGRGRGDRESREPRERESRDSESYALPQNYTPIVLPGESISKYRGVEPLETGPLDDESLEAAAAALAEEAQPVTEAAAIEPQAVEATPVVQSTQAEPVVEATAPEAAPAEVAAEPAKTEEEPLSSASYSGADGLPSLRYAPEVEEPTAKEEVKEEAKADVAQAEAVQAELHEKPEEVIAEAPAQTQVVEAVPVAAAEEVIPEAASQAGSAAGRRGWRDRVSKIFGSHVEQELVAEQHEQEPAPVEREEEVAAAEEQHASSDSRLGSFVIEGGHVEHEELDDEEAEMPALAEHFDRYEESDDEVEASNGSQIGSAVRESGEETELEDEEYDFGGEEFEESELLADGSEAETEEEEGEEAESGEEAEGTSAPAPGRPRGRFDRQRRGRRGVPPQRGGGGRMRSRQQSRAAVPLISELLKEGQEILVQIAKEPIGKKGARITSHIALPGRFLVYMPTVNHIGVSRKISSDDERQRLKRIVSSERENGHGGFIVRTAAANIKEDELRADIRFLKHLWNEIRTRAEGSKSPALIYHDLNLVERILRDQVTSDFSQIWVDNESEYERVVRFASRFQPSLVRRIKLYTKDTPLFEQFGIHEEINKSLKSKVWLKSGGYIVINQTEALVAIDINTGKYVGKTARLEDTIVKTNIDAVKEIVRQVRLRDLGGIIVVDFIDMDERKNRQKVMQALEEAMKADRAPSKILQFNDFGLVAITRKRVKQSLERTLGTPCPYCDATGFVKSVQTICNEIYVEMRKIRRHVESKEVILRVNPEVAKELKSGNGRWLQEMEELIGHPVLVKSDAQLHQEKFDMNY
jgi:ribonuclease G